MGVSTVVWSQSIILFQLLSCSPLYFFSYYFVASEYWDILSCSADVHVLLHSTDGHSLPHPTPLRYQLLGNIYENSSILLWLHVARNKVCTNWLINSSFHARGMRDMPLMIIFFSLKTRKTVTHTNQQWDIIRLKKMCITMKMIPWDHGTQSTVWKC